jgi:hypothetical protein
MHLKKIYVYVSLFFILSNSHAETYPDLRTILNSQINNSVINIPKGTYLLDLISSGTYSFMSKNNVVINGNGSTIICNRQSQAFQFYNCTNVAFKNLTIEYDPPCSTQGTITKMSSDKRTWDVEIHSGYPIDNLGISRIQAFGKNTLELVRNFGTATGSSLTKTSDKTIQLTISGWSNNTVQIGDYVALDALATGTTQPHTIYMWGCKNMELDSIVVYGSNSYSFFEDNCESNHYYRCIVTRQPLNSKYTIQPLRAGIADGIHSRSAKVGPIIEDCRIEYNGDDCIAIHGVFYPVYAVDESNRCVYILISSSVLSNVRINAGDSIICVNNDGNIRGNSATNLIGNTLESPTTSQINACIAKFASINNVNKYIYGVKVKLDNWIPGIASGDILYSKDRIGSGFKVINNNVGHTRSRAILIKASDGIIDGNTIAGCELSGIVVTPQFSWMEAGCSNNVEISNNKIQSCMFRSSLTNSIQAGALVVAALNPMNRFCPAGNLNNISIHDNIIEDCPRPNVVLSSITGVKYYKNAITPSTTILRNHGNDFGITNINDLWMINVLEFSPTYTDVIETKNNLNNVIYIDNNSNIIFSGIRLGESAQMTVYDILGRKTTSAIITSSTGVSLGNLKNGIYLVSIKYNQKVLNKKILLNK